MDFNNDQLVSGGDFLVFAPVFGHGSPGHPPLTTADQRYDLNGDGKITGGDFLVISPFFGKHCIQQLTVNVACSPTTDTGKFNVLIDGAIPATGASLHCSRDTGTGLNPFPLIPIVNVSVGAHTVSETAGTGTASPTTPPSSAAPAPAPAPSPWPSATPRHAPSPTPVCLEAQLDGGADPWR